MYLRNLPGTTLVDLAEEFNQHLTTWGGGSHQITPHLEEEQPFIDLGGHEVFAGKEGLLSFAKFYDIPPKFFARLDREQQQFLLRTQIDKDDRDVTVHYSENVGVSEIRPSGEVRVRPHKLVEGLLKTFPESSPIVDSWSDASELRIDVIFPEDHELGQGGDLSVGDVSRGGIRVFQDRKINSAPQIEKLVYRLVCTNGMEVADPSLKVSAVGANELEIYALFEAEVARAVDVLMDDIRHFYDLRNQTVGSDPTGTLRRLAVEQGLPIRTVSNLEDLIPTLEHGEDTTVFDLVNLITNQANNPNIDVRSSTHRNLQRAGGGIVNDHAERCVTCHSRIA
jgi:hypothetical protein